MNNKKLALVLSGGSAYGFAHLGVIKELLRNDILPDIIVGTSMGAIIGGLFASGVTIDEMEDVLSKFTRGRFIDFSLFGMFKKGLLQGDKVSKIFEQFLGDKNIEDCPIKYACVSSNLKTGQKVVFTSGNMVTAIRSSMSVPGVFAPVEMENMCLVDGGISDNLPVDVARDLGAGKVIAVDVCSFYQMQNDLRSTLDIIISASNLAVANNVLSQMDKGDVYIKIDQPNVSFDKFTSDNIQTSINYGCLACSSHMNEIKALLEDKKEQDRQI